MIRDRDPKGGPQPPDKLQFKSRTNLMTYKYDYFMEYRDPNTSHLPSHTVSVTTTNYPFEIVFENNKFKRCTVTKSPIPDWTLEYWAYLAEVEWTIKELVDQANRASMVHTETKVQQSDLVNHREMFESISSQLKDLSQHKEADLIGVATEEH